MIWRMTRERKRCTLFGPVVPDAAIRLFFFYPLLKLKEMWL